MSIEYIRKTYNVPAKRGGRVRWADGNGKKYRRNRGRGMTPAERALIEAALDYAAHHDYPKYLTVPAANLLAERSQMVATVIVGVEPPERSARTTG